MARSDAETAAANAATAEKAAAKALLIRLKWLQAAAKALVNDQDINDLDMLRYLTPDMATAICCTLRKPGGGDDGFALSVLAERC